VAVVVGDKEAADMFAAVKERMDLLAEGMEDMAVDDVAPCFRIAQSNDVGRHVVTTRKVTKGEVIFRDVPIVTGPSRESEPACVSCYRLIDLTCTRPEVGGCSASGVPLGVTPPPPEQGPIPHVLCPRCGWPLCSSTCANSDNHKAECHYLFQSGCRINAVDSDALYDVVTVLRCLYLRDTNPQAWADLLTLQESNPKELNEELADRAKKVTGFICGTLKLGNTFSKELVFDICTRLDVNSFEVPLGRSSATVQGIFTIACMVEHSCIPTGHRCFNSDMSITVRSAYGAEEGDAVSICYTDSLWPTAARREHLVYSKDFLCVCDRCQDETENETYISGIRCTKCPAGYFLPENPIGWGEEEGEMEVDNQFPSDCAARWICNECGMEAPKGYQDIVNEKVASAIAKLEEAGLTPEACEKFLKTYGKVLHPNHAHMLDIKYSYLNILGHSEGCTMSQMTDVQLQTKENLARNFLEIARKILPGISRLKGTALYELYLSIQQRALRAFHDPGTWGGLGSGDVLSMLTMAGEHLQECIDCLKYEPTHQAEGKLCEQARDEQCQLAGLMASVKARMAP